MTIRSREANEPTYSDETYVEPPGWPQWVLDRHGATVLRPADLLRDKELEGVRTTAYRSAALIISNNFIDDLVGPINDVLQDIGLRLVPPEVSLVDAVTPLMTWIPGHGRRSGPIQREIVSSEALCEHIPSVPRAVGVQAVDDKVAVRIDAWVALRRIRYALRHGDFDHLTAEQREELGRISLDHLMQCAQFEGVPMYAPTTTGKAMLGGLGGGGGYVSEGRHPIAHVPMRPLRNDGWTGRRLVVAMLDTGVCEHPWFATSPAFTTGPSNGFLHTYAPTRKEIGHHIPQVQGFPLTNVLLSSEDGPLYTDPIGSLVNAALGHGTFIAGLIHQEAPDVDVLAVRVLRADNVGYESDVLLALYLLYARNTEARAKGRDQQETEARRTLMVDVVSLSLGYYDETWLHDRKARFVGAIRQLTESGVVVLAAAGNDATTRPFLPAALSGPSAEWGGPDVVGVGALNPNGSVAWYSNGGDSVSVRATGTCVVSTFPPCARGAIAPAMLTADRQSMDIDDFHSGFAMWSGTSFATPMVAAKLVSDLVAGGVESIDEESMRQRAERAVTELPKLT